MHNNNKINFHLLIRENFSLINNNKKLNQKLNSSSKWPKKVRQWVMHFDWKLKQETHNAATGLENKLLQPRQLKSTIDCQKRKQCLVYKRPWLGHINSRSRIVSYYDLIDLTIKTKKNFNNWLIFFQMWSSDSNQTERDNEQRVTCSRHSCHTHLWLKHTAGHGSGDSAYRA